MARICKVRKAVVTGQNGCTEKEMILYMYFQFKFALKPSLRSIFLPLSVAFLATALPVSAQELAAKESICFDLIAGLSNNTPFSNEDILISCYDNALGFCASKPKFEDCIAKTNDVVLEALHHAQSSFDVDSLNTGLLGRKITWVKFKRQINEIETTNRGDIESEMLLFRLSFLASISIIGLRSSLE
jgi:hypothetical protein